MPTPSRCAPTSGPSPPRPPGDFDEEIVAVETPSRRFAADEGPRATTTMEALAGLRPVVRGGTLVTAGNASSLNDGAAAILVASEAAIARLGLTPRARVIGGASAGISPEVMGLGPVPAIQKLMARTGF